MLMLCSVDDGDVMILFVHFQDLKSIKKEDEKKLNKPEMLHHLVQSLLQQLRGMLQ